MLIKDKIIIEEEIENLNNLLADDMNPFDYKQRFNRMTRDEANTYVSQNWKAAEVYDKVT